jgi:hypothetical protein
MANVSLRLIIRLDAYILLMVDYARGLDMNYVMHEPRYLVYVGMYVNGHG